MVMDNVMIIGMMFVFIVYKICFSSVLDNLVNIFIEFNMFGVYFFWLSDIVFIVLDKCFLVNDKLIVFYLDIIYSVIFNKYVIIENFVYWYGDYCFIVFENLNLIVKRGEFIVIVGVSGSGKSIFLKCLMGFYVLLLGVVEYIGFFCCLRVVFVL